MMYSRPPSLLKIWLLALSVGVCGTAAGLVFLTAIHAVMI